MTRIDVVPIYRWLWVAFTVNDRGQYRSARLGVSDEHAHNRVVKAIGGSTP